MLTPSTAPLVVALDNLDLKALELPPRVADAEWKAFVAAAKLDAVPLLDTARVPLVGGQRQLDHQDGGFSIAGRAIATAVVAKSETDRWQGEPKALSALYRDFRQPSGLSPDELEAWRLLWSLFHHEAGPGGMAPPWWLVRGFAGDYAALSTSDHVSAALDAIETTQVHRKMAKQMKTAGFPVGGFDAFITFVSQAAANGFWVLSVEARG